MAAVGQGLTDGGFVAASKSQAIAGGRAHIIAAGLLGGGVAGMFHTVTTQLRGTRRAGGVYGCSSYSPPSGSC